MKNRSLPIAAATGLFMMTSMAFAGPVDSVVSQLEDLGYENISVTRTLLGRARIVAEQDSHSREIVIHPRSGEILRDAVDTGRGQSIAGVNSVKLGNGAAKSGATGNGSSNANANGGGNGNGNSGGNGNGNSGGNGNGNSGGNGNGNSGGNGNGNSGGNGNGNSGGNGNGNSGGNGNGNSGGNGNGNGNSGGNGNGNSGGNGNGKGGGG